MKTAIALLVALSLAIPVYAQDKPAEQPDVLKQTVELEAMKKQIAALQQQLQAATAPERAEQLKQRVITFSEAVKKEYAAACASVGGKWSWMQANINGQTTALIGCTGK